MSVSHRTVFLCNMFNISNKHWIKNSHAVSMYTDVWKVQWETTSYQHLITLVSSFLMIITARARVVNIAFLEVPETDWKSPLHVEAGFLRYSSTTVIGMCPLFESTSFCHRYTDRGFCSPLFTDWVICIPWTWVVNSIWTCHCPMLTWSQRRHIHLTNMKQFTVWALHTH